MPGNRRALSDGVTVAALPDYHSAPDPWNRCEGQIASDELLQFK